MVLFNPLPGRLVNKKQSTDTKYKNHKFILTQIQLLKTQKRARLHTTLSSCLPGGFINTNTKYKKNKPLFKNYNCSKHKEEPSHPRPSLYHVAISMQCAKTKTYKTQTQLFITQKQSLTMAYSSPAPGD